ncbi:MAG: restriction endonuclease subunit S [Spirochaetia bacterium]|nr:restriction endonuclease subunit S [Spirochaetia bacterium]
MKQTEIGLIPDDWEVKTLGEIGEPCMCKRILKEQTSSTGDVPFYKIGTFGGIPDAYISRELFEQYKEQYNYPKKGTLLLSAAGTIGRVVVFDGKDSYFQDSNIVWIDNDETKVTNDFLFYCYSRMQWKTEEGGIVSRLYNANLKSTSFIAPKSLAEQQRIAKALSDVDALISTTEKLIKKKKNIKQGAMQNLLTGKKRLPGFAKSTTYKQTELGPIPEDWEVKSLCELCSLITKQTGFDYSATIKPSLVLEHQKNTLPFIQNKDFEEERINFETDFYIPIAVAKKFLKIYLNEDVLLISISGRIGNVAYFKHTQDAFIGGAVGIAHFYDKDNINYCMRYLLSPNGQMQIFANEKSGAQHNLTIADVRKLSIPMPKDNKEQTAIANVLSSMDKEIEILNTKLEKYRNLKIAMMQQLLTGKIRLVN